MKADARFDIVPNVLRELGQPDWLLPRETVVFSSSLGYLHDDVQIVADLLSETRPRRTTGSLSGRLWRIFQYTQKKGLLVEALMAVHDDLLTRLRLVVDHPLKELACRALNSDDDLKVFTDAVLERGEIRESDVEEQGLDFARSIVAPLIFTDWQTERWPVNSDLEDTGLVLEGAGGPIKIYSRAGALPSGPYMIRMQGSIGVIDG